MPTMPEQQTPIAPGWYRERVSPCDELCWDGGRFTGRRQFGTKGDAPPSRTRSVLKAVRTLLMLLGPAVLFMLLLWHIAHDEAFWRSPEAPSLTSSTVVVLEA